MHEKMCYNPLDMSNNKYQPPRVPSGSYGQRDMNPLGYQLKRDSLFMKRAQRARELQDRAEDLLSGKKTMDKKSLDMFSKYQK